MKISKLSGSLVAATLILGLNAVATADLSEECLDVIADIEGQAASIRQCDKNGLDYPTPIWQYKGTKGDGCVVHEKVARKLDEDRTEPPPPIKKGNNVAAGAANDFLNGKYDAGQAKLQDFIDTLMYAAKAVDQEREDALVEWAVGVQTDAMACQ